MKTIVIHLLVSLLLFYVYDSDALVLKALQRYQQNNNAVNSGNTTLTIFEKIRRFKEAFREMMRMNLEELRSAGVKPNGTQPSQGLQVVPAILQSTVGVPTVQVPPTSMTGVPAVQPGVQTATVTQPGVAAAPVAQPSGAATAPVAQPSGAASAPLAQQAVSTVPVAQSPVSNPLAQSAPTAAVVQPSANVAQPAATIAQNPASVAGQPVAGMPTATV